jgi:hypothetical protein
MNLEIHLASRQAINYTYCPLLLVDVPSALDPLRASLALHLPIRSYIPRLCLTRDGIAEFLLHQGLCSPPISPRQPPIIEWVLLYASYSQTTNFSTFLLYCQVHKHHAWMSGAFSIRPESVGICPGTEIWARPIGIQTDRSTPMGTTEASDKARKQLEQVSRKLINATNVFSLSSFQCPLHL